MATSTGGEGCDGTHIPSICRAAGVPGAHGLHARRPAGLCDLPCDHSGPLGHGDFVVLKLTVSVQQLRNNMIGIGDTFVTDEFLGF